MNAKTEGNEKMEKGKPTTAPTDDPPRKPKNCTKLHQIEVTPRAQFNESSGSRALFPRLPDLRRASN